MSDERSDVLLTSSQVEGWKKRRAELERQVAEAQRELSSINQWLDAVALLPGGKIINVEAKTGDASSPQPSEPMTDAIERIVKESPAPISRAAVKEKLQSLGFERNRLGNYFYTVVGRLKDREKIAVLTDGRLASIRSVSGP